MSYIADHQKINMDYFLEDTDNIVITSCDIHDKDEIFKVSNNIEIRDSEAHVIDHVAIYSAKHDIIFENENLSVQDAIFFTSENITLEHVSIDCPHIYVLNSANFNEYDTSFSSEINYVNQIEMDALMAYYLAT